MELKDHTSPDKLLKYSFLWNEVRLVIAALSLILGAVPILYRVLASSSAYNLITIGSVISGLAALYLLYLWYAGGYMLFGGKDKTDLVAFLIGTLSGVHLGLGGLMGTNIIMSVLYGTGILLTLAIYAGGILYLWSAYHLWKRWKASGEAIFSKAPAAPMAPSGGANTGGGMGTPGA